MEKGMEEPNNNYKYGIKSTFAQVSRFSISYGIKFDKPE